MASATHLGGNKYKIYVELGYNEKGKRIRRTKTVTAKSQRALKRAMTEFQIEVANQQNSHDIENITFSVFVERWMKVYVRTKLSLKTRNTYESYLKNGILDYFGDMKMAKIKTFHIEEFFHEQKTNNKKALTGKFLALKSIFSRAVKWKVIADNPMKDVDKPEVKPRYREIEFYNAEQLKHLIKTLDKVYPKHRIQIKLAALVGLRIAEIAGIRHECLNFKEETILIDKTLQYDKEKKTFILAPTKNKKEREVDVPPTLMEEIRKYAIAHKKLRLECGSAWSPLLDDQGEPVNLLFTNKIGYPNHVNSIGNEWRKIVKRHNLPELNFHGLRHTCASFLLSKDTNFKIIQAQLGHADVKETINRYSHLTKKDKKKAINVFEEIL